MNNEKETYYDDQLAKIKYKATMKVKITDFDNKTNWLDLNYDSALAISKWLAEKFNLPSTDTLIEAIKAEEFDEFTVVTGDMVKFMEEHGKRVYDIISPDGFSFYMDTAPYNTLEEAQAGFVTDVLSRYKHQGYYSDSNRNRIPLDELHEYCIIRQFIVGVGYNGNEHEILLPLNKKK